MLHIDQRSNGQAVQDPRTTAARPAPPDSDASSASSASSASGGRAVAVVLDVVDSRRHPDQSALLRGVAEHADRWLVGEGHARSSAPSVGDELQALYAAPSLLGEAVRDLARLRLSLLVEPPSDRPVELRAGIGVGEVIGEGDAAAPAQSGSAWWAAREALEEAARRRNGWPPTRWWVRGAGPATNATLLALDTIAAGFDRDDERAAFALLCGSSAAAIATSLGVVPSTVSSRLHGHGIYGFVRTLEVLVDEVAAAQR